MPDAFSILHIVSNDIFFTKIAHFNLSAIDFSRFLHFLLTIIVYKVTELPIQALQ